MYACSTRWSPTRQPEQHSSSNGIRCAARRSGHYARCSMRARLPRCLAVKTGRNDCSERCGSASKENSPSCLELLLLPRCLHHIEGLVDRNLATSLQNRTALGHFDGCVERIRLEDGLPACHRPHRAVTDCAVARNAFCRRREGVAPVDNRTAEFFVPCPPRLQHRGLFGFRRGHAATAIEKYK